MSHIFISYSREDVDFARYLRAQFETEGYRVWMDEQRLHPGSDWWDEIETNIITCSAFVVVMSPNSAQSKWVKREILCAEDNHRPIFPILLAGKVFGRLADLQAEDMIGGITAKLSERLLASLKTLIAPNTSKTLSLQVVKGNVLTIPADALVLKYSGGFNGASAQVFEGLKEFGIKVSIDVLRTAIGSYQLMDSKLALPTPLVLYVSTPFVR
ncbi:MAG TPA: toll/interleukin-1 receptor domain-containing protein [Aggregatilineales bacterium]|nr:toll/interleukin-1 receptor domain-containing protein [Aggregatilineales bacterium]